MNNATAQAAAVEVTSTALELRALHKRFGATPIIRGVSLGIARGERHAMIGPNGAGKSTLFNLISGRFAPTAGSIRLNGEDVSGLPPYQLNRRGLARSFQVTNIFPRLSVFENIRCSVLWSLGYRYSFWHRVDRLRDANAQAVTVGRGARFEERAQLADSIFRHGNHRCCESIVFLRNRKWPT